MFGFQAGDSLLLLADKTQGIALQPFSYAEAFFDAVRRMKEKE